MANEIEIKKKSRKALRTSFTKAANELEALFSVDKLDRESIEVAWELLLSKYDDLKIVDNEIYELLLEVKCQIRELILGEFPQTDSFYKNITDINYYLYTRDYIDEPINLANNVDKLNKKLETKVIIHGYTETPNVQWYKDMARAYLTNKRANVIAVDWSKRAKSPYTNAIKESNPVGTAIGYYLLKLNNGGKINLWKTHVISHSLGCHVAGFLGKFIYRETGRKIKRITGLDPAGPLFEFPFIGVNDRLSKGDSDFVDILHTDSGVLGFRSSIGDADYFANGGFAVQPGCKLPSIDNLHEYVCSHQRSHQYFIESINSEKFIAKSCSSWSSYLLGFCKINANVLFGENAPPSATGKFYFRTNPAPPYAVS
ncbi:hypothetical protein RN001_012437 [Aquatica leii]|uniref:Lipase domain-containing protein n=1 Tax=Aquatica leii TaxID=1421715 RepID=A0AAN7SPH4_9COLE|nr:hypothetical protein RN001_012437 [Aquatica leii]